MLPRIGATEAKNDLAGCLIVLASALAWSIGSFLQRHRRAAASGLVVAAYQLLLGGACMVLLGCALGEHRLIGPDTFTPGAVWAFCHLLVVGSLVGFVAYTWLLGHVSTTVVGTYAYVNPVVALLVGAYLGHEANFTWPVVGGMVVILAGVALVRGGHAVKVLQPAQPEAGAFTRGKRADATLRPQQAERLTANRTGPGPGSR
jgi:drug/metabolite transporter (DMT)-like permease